MTALSARELRGALAGFGLGVTMHRAADPFPRVALVVTVLAVVAVWCAVWMEWKGPRRWRDSPPGTKPDPLGLEPGWVDASKPNRNGKGGPSW